jgi:hypothetical protein
MTHRSQPQARTPFARLVHTLLLLAWLLSSQGIAPAMVLAAATMDGDHAVQVGASEKGDLTVVLAHADSVVREHDPLCALIVAFAETSSEADADHVLSFKTVEDASRRVFDDVTNVDLSVPMAPLQINLPAKTPPVLLKQGTLAPAWSPGLELKAGKTVMLC